MTDRELLELAAKAAGIKGQWMAEPPDGLNEERYFINFVLATGYIWNPLTDDGDALRLMVRLRFHPRNFSPLDDDFDSVPMGMVEVWQEGGEDPLHIEYFKRGDDRLIVTRRAIVRAAAEIGRTR